MDDMNTQLRPTGAELTDIDWKTLGALAEDGHGTIPEGADLERLDELGLVTRVGITWGLTAAGRARLTAEA
ncbi:hypothetical protein [Antarcticirhabdus aurantiaca]|uniref:Uncharacterized protein n=1 Tax=Antarcticirhabdus aurantiaca TaxID=2606717 RepID=A0ACD4NP28_9HYPH|nr:hypothetical protein [Antarcticirhabdus aurantiaca]WAJ28543.1 hypothetical protein OXU80_27715 [Jeongeuplla avenae]